MDTKIGHWVDQLHGVGIKEKNFGTSDGLSWIGEGDGKIISYSPIDGKAIAEVSLTSDEEYERVVQRAVEAFKVWRMIPAPKRGEIIRQIGLVLREKKEELARVITIEMGKIYQEALGEVQEVIDICDFAVGLSRQLYGLTIQSERPHHRLYEQWHPLGVVGVITAFNFPMAVWGWNAMIATVCGDCIVWKPSEKTPLSAIAIMKVIQEVLQKNNVPAGVFNLIIGDRTLGQKLASDKRIPLISATGSIPMGRAVAETVAKRLGRTILELGGNNAIILTPSANLSLAIRAIVFAAVGTTGQRCTTLRRLIIHESIYDKVVTLLKNTYEQLRNRIGNPLDPNTLIGPLIDRDAVEKMQFRLKRVQEEGGKVLLGGEVIQVPGLEGGHYVVPALVEAENHYESVQTETFAPILYLLKYKDLDEAIAIQNGVPQGLSSAIFTENLKEAEKFLSPEGSDCGIANVNIGTSGAEIGGAFGGEKETGGGRESGSDAWKAYMRRQTVTINYGDDLPLAQGIEFNV